MERNVLKVETENETCCICGAFGELLTPEEHDAGAPQMQVPLRVMLLQLNNNKVLPDGRLCISCVRRAIEAYEFSNTLSSRGVPPLSEKIRALRRRLHELTQKIDVFIVVGGAGAGAGGTYNEEDIIMVERDALAAATAADDEDLERARNARGDTVYQCSVCPLSFQRVSEYRAHAAQHPAAALHSCWTCGAQFAARDALLAHARDHGRQHLKCHLCNITFQTSAALRAHEETSCGGGQCPLCGCAAGGGAALRAHVAAAHAPACGACCRRFPSPAALAAHAHHHTHHHHYVCGYDGCILRFGTRSNLISHIRKCHGGEGVGDDDPPPAAPAAPPAPPAVPCQHCERTFGSVAAMKRHARVHRSTAAATIYHHQEAMESEDMELEGELEGRGEGEGEVEYLEVDALDDHTHTHTHTYTD